MEINNLSDTWNVRKLDREDIELIYDLMKDNTIFYQYHPPFVTRESILEDMEALPPGKEYDDKYYIGFFQDNSLVAIMDLILDYPTENIDFIGLFMMNTKYQNQGLGSKIICECMKALRKQGYKKIKIGVDKKNPQSYSFWRKNGFTKTDENEYIKMELIL